MLIPQLQYIHKWSLFFLCWSCWFHRCRFGEDSWQHIVKVVENPVVQSCWFHNWWPWRRQSRSHSCRSSRKNRWDHWDPDGPGHSDLSAFGHCTCPPGGTGGNCRRFSRSESLFPATQVRHSTRLGGFSSCCGIRANRSPLWSAWSPHPWLRTHLLLPVSRLPTADMWRIDHGVDQQVVGCQPQVWLRWRAGEVSAKKEDLQPRWRRTFACLKQQLQSPAYWTVRLRVAGGSLYSFSTVTEDWRDACRWA